VLALIIGAHTLVETARDTLFLSRLPPERLAFVYVAVALGTLLLTPLSQRLVAWVGARNALVFTLLGSAFGIGWFRLRPPSTLGVFGLYVFGGLAITLLVAEFWVSTRCSCSLHSASYWRRWWRRSSSWRKKERVTERSRRRGRWMWLRRGVSHWRSRLA
jgi:hypothetical protein